jgi:predicted nucleic acid binding AN1-type Zn finger protein
MVTCDESGIIIVWTIILKSTYNQNSNNNNNNNNNNSSSSSKHSNYIISRRPQRLFYCDPHSSGLMICKISWYLGVIVVVSGDKVNVYSIERDELIRSFYIDVSLESSQLPTYSSPLSSTDSSFETNHYHQSIKSNEFNTVNSNLNTNYSQDTTSTTNPHTSCSSKGNNNIHSLYTTTGPSTHIYGCNRNIYDHNHSELISKPIIITQNMILSDFGMVIVYVELTRQIESLIDYGEHHHNHTEYYVIIYSISGYQAGILQCTSEVTYMKCPDRYDYVMLGYDDGTVSICCAMTLHILFSFQPHLFCVPVSISDKDMYHKMRNSVISLSSSSPSLSTTSSASSSDSIDDKKHERSNNSTADNHNKPSLTTDPSPIISISWGPHRDRPSIMCITTESGILYLKAFPDFMKWERNRIPTTLQQLTNVPIQAVKGTIIQAQNWTAETAGVLVQNARILADDALIGLKKNKVVKGVASFFGLGR